MGEMGSGPGQDQEFPCRVVVVVVVVVVPGLAEKKNHTQKTKQT